MKAISSIETIDASDELDTLAKRNPGLFRSISSKPNAQISRADGMLSDGNARYYFTCGLDAVRLCLLGLDRRGITPGKVQRVLDYACGFGRVGRVLQAAFPNAQLVGADVDPKALIHYEAILEVETAQLSKAADAARALGGHFDLIWVGSLFTHLPESHVDALLKDLGNLLSTEGVLAFTLHGEYVVERLGTGEKDYGLDAEGIGKVIQGYQERGFGFSPYPKMKSYGISAMSPDRIEAKASGMSLKLLLQEKRGWVKHQDFYAVTR